MSYKSLNTEFNSTDTHNRIKLPFVNQKKFILLFIVSFGLYGIWWMFKAWEYYQRKEISDILPAARAIFAIFFAYSLFQKIIKEAGHKSYSKSYDSSMLFIGIILLNLLVYLPEPFNLLSLLSCIAYLPAVNALNYVIDVDDVYARADHNSLSGRQRGLIIIGGIMWILSILGMYLMATGALVE